MDSPSVTRPDHGRRDKSGAPAGDGVEETLYQACFLARCIDETESRFVAAGEANFHVSGAGHEGVAALAFALRPQDWIHGHYRDKALLVARGMEPREFFHALFCTAGSCSNGRQMNAHLSARRLNVLSMAGPVGNNALQAVGVAAEVREHKDSPVVVCCVGDGTTQQGEFLEAVGEAVRENLRVLFLVEDNGLAISTNTRGRTFFDQNGVPAKELFGVAIERMDGRLPWVNIAPFARVVERLREGGGPAIVVFDVDRLANHTNADDERVYRALSERERVRSESDPVANLRLRLLEIGVDENALARREIGWRTEIQRAAAEARSAPDPEPCVDDRTCSDAPDPEPVEEMRATGEPAELTMLEAIRATLKQWLGEDERVTLFGQDIEDPKGDVFGITRGLSTAFPGRVRNAPLSESTIVGTAIGRALAGGRPVAFVQFSDFLPLAYNQIASELGTLAWRTNGEWTAPVLVLAPCGGYRPGLGPFHAQTNEAVFAHHPGIDVLMPSNATDAAGLLQAAFISGRPALFLYPKAVLNDPNGAAPACVERLRVPIGKASRLRAGSDLTLVAYGNTVPLAQSAADHLGEAGVTVDLFDLRSISPWDRETITASALRTGRLVVVHEDNLSFGVGAEIVAAAVEAGSGKIRAARVARPDVYVPCNYRNQLALLPSVRSVVEAAARVLDLDLHWEKPGTAASDVSTIPIQGSSPADQSVTVTAWLVKHGDEVEEGQLIAELEADKAIFEFVTPEGGVIEELLAQPGDRLRVGEPLLRIRPHVAGGSSRRTSDGPAPLPVIRRREARRVAIAAASSAEVMALTVPVGVVGGANLTNSALAKRFREYSAEDIFQRTGIANRVQLAAGETVLDLAVRAARRAMTNNQFALSEIDAVIVSTTTPPLASPSLACSVLHQLGGGGEPREIPAFDISAACSGYIYGLANAHGLLSRHPDWRILFVTAEALSTVVDPDDFGTAIIFGDAATATILWSGEVGEREGFTLRHPPVISAKGDSGNYLRVGFPPAGRIDMEGGRVFAEAVRRMGGSLKVACDQAGIQILDLDWIVPHQANGRLINAMAERNKIPVDRVIDSIRDVGNTSSSSIPLALAGAPHLRGRIGLCAFGGGLTYGAAIVERR
ncbi:MAG: thiamine pyrophosphate-dependent enzyme [Opitutaceae bacterium]